MGLGVEAKGLLFSSQYVVSAIWVALFFSWHLAKAVEDAHS